MPLLQLQQHLEGMNNFYSALDVRQFVIDDAIRKHIPGAIAGLPEQLFLSEDDGHLDIALYIAPSILQRLTADNPLAYLHAGNLESFCVALEGVSHFLFVAFRSGIKRPVTALELELQAEVDKFLLTCTLLVKQGVKLLAASRAMLRALFDRYQLREDLPAEERFRYHLASRSAKRYCRALLHKHGSNTDINAMVADARDFFRGGLESKLCF